MVDALQIRQHLAEYVLGMAQLQEFEDWFVPATWDIHKSNDPEAEALTDEIESNLSEYTGGQLSREDLRKILSGLAHVPVGSQGPFVRFEAISVGGPILPPIPASGAISEEIAATLIAA